MNKKMNTLLFVLGATAFNIVVTVLLMFLLLVIYSRYLNQLLPAETYGWPIVIIFIGSIVASFFIYRFAMGLLLKKVDMDKYFDPIFSGKRRR